MSNDKAKCEKCGAVVSEKVEKYSRHHYGNRVLCYKCQKKEGGSDAWVYDKSKKEEGADKGSSGAFVDEQDKEIEEYAEEIGAEMSAEEKELDAMIVELITDMSIDRKNGFYAWLKSEYNVDCIDTLSVSAKRRVLKEVETLVDAGKSDVVVAVSEPEAALEGEEKTEKKSEADSGVHVVEKVIEVDWDNIPKQIFVPKLHRALEYLSEDKGEFFTVGKANAGGTEHRATLGSCDCGDFVYRGTSLNPCVHQVRVKYSDDEIRAKLKEFGAEKLPAKVAKVRNGKMMIHGMMPGLAEIGKIKIGGKSDKPVRGQLLPQKWDHFAIATLMKDDEGRLVMDDEMNTIIGDDCKALNIFLCYDDPSMNMPTMYSLFSQSRLVCMGNGVVATRTQDDGSKVEQACNPKECEAYRQKQCKPYGRLSVILADSGRIGGTYVFRTTSWNSIRNILSSMAFIKAVTGGVLAGLPLKMRLLPMSVVPNGVGHSVKIYVVNIEYSGKISDLKEAAVEEVERRLRLGMNMKQIEEVDRGLLRERVIEEAEEEAVDIAEELAPEEDGAYHGFDCAPPLWAKPPSPLRQVVEEK